MPLTSRVQIENLYGIASRTLESSLDSLEMGELEEARELLLLSAETIAELIEKL